MRGLKVIILLRLCKRWLAGKRLAMLDLMEKHGYEISTDLIKEFDKKFPTARRRRPCKEIPA